MSQRNPRRAPVQEVAELGKLGAGKKAYADYAVSRIVDILGDGWYWNKDLVPHAVEALKMIGTKKAYEELIRMSNTFPKVMEGLFDGAGIENAPQAIIPQLVKAHLRNGDRVHSYENLSLKVFNDVVACSRKNPAIIEDAEIHQMVEGKAGFIICKSNGDSEADRAEIWDSMQQGKASGLLRSFDPEAVMEAKAWYERTLQGEPASPFAYDHEFTFKG